MLKIRDLQDDSTPEESIRSTLQTRFPLHSHKGFFWQYCQQGYKDFTFGCKVGPIKTLTGLAHELAHAIEFGAAAFEFRAKQSGSFHFQAPSRWMYDRLVCEPVTGGMSEREARTMGIEARLLELFVGEPLDKEDLCAYAFRLREFLPDWIAYHGRESEYGKLVMNSYEAFDTERCLAELKRWFDKTHLTVSLVRIREQQSEFRAAA